MKGSALLYLLAAVGVIASCNSQHSSGENMRKTFDREGHRGCRGLMPENTIPAMYRALELGVTTLEMDVVITADRKVLVSHDPFFSWEISTTPDGGTFTAKEERQYNIFRMTYAEASRWDVGSRPHPRFPRQEKMKVSKPLLANLIDSVEAYAKKHGLPSPDYNIETKSEATLDGSFNPGPEEFTDLLMGVVKAKGIGKRVVVQSFDPRTLQVMHRKYRRQRTSLLIEGMDKRGLDKQLEDLGFVPDTYSPEYYRVDEAMVKACHDRKMRILPWTVNDRQSIDRLIALGVDGIITDYPDLFQSAVSGRQSAPHSP
jgi:glycerophosphoryl diester phosphodiesterase